MNAETGGGLRAEERGLLGVAVADQWQDPAVAVTILRVIVPAVERILGDRDAALARVEALHVNNDGPNDWCAGCHDQGRRDEWPCATIAALHPAPSEAP